MASRSRAGASASADARAIADLESIAQSLQLPALDASVLPPGLLSHIGALQRSGVDPATLATLVAGAVLGALFATAARPRSAHGGAGARQRRHAKRAAERTSTKPMGVGATPAQPAQRRRSRKGGAPARARRRAKRAAVRASAKPAAASGPSLERFVAAPEFLPATEAAAPRAAAEADATAPRVAAEGGMPDDGQSKRQAALVIAVFDAKKAVESADSPAAEKAAREQLTEAKRALLVCIGAQYPQYYFDQDGAVNEQGNAALTRIFG